MTPERAAAIFRALLETPAQELSHFARRNGLEGNPTPQDLAQAREILQALDIALTSDPGPNWARIATAWSAMRAHHGELRLDARGPQQPSWIQPAAPPRPTLGDPAPGTAVHQQREEHRQRFVPSAPAGGAYAAPPAQPSQPAPQAPPSHPHAQGHGVPPAPPVRPWGPPAYQAAAPSAGVPAAPPYPGAQHAAQAYGPPAHPSQPAHPYGSQSAPPPHAAAPYVPQPPQPPPQHAHYAQPAPHAQAAHAQAAHAQASHAQAAHAQVGQSPPNVETSVATYAAFCAACAAQPDRVAATMTEYGLVGSDARTRLDDAWQDRFDDDPALHQQWEKLFHQFRDRLR